MDWQTLIVLLIVLFACSRAVGWCWRFARGSSSGCGGGCDRCPSSQTRGTESPLVELKPLHRPSRHELADRM